MSSCITRRKLNAYLWLNNSPIPKELCEKNPQLYDYGLYRILNSGKIEFVGFCEVKAQEFFSMHKKDLERLLNESNDGQKD